MASPTVEALPGQVPAEHEFLVRNECRIVLDIAAEGIAL